MNETARVILRTLSPLIMPLLYVVGWIVKTAYSIFAGPFEERFAARAAGEFRDEIIDSLGFMIDGYGAEMIPIIPNREVRGFDYVEVLIKIAPMRLEIARCRGDFSAFVAPEFDPSDRQDLFQVLNVCRDRPVVVGYFRDQWDLAAQFRPHVDCVLNWLTPEQYPELKRRLDSPDVKGERRKLKALENELNRRHFGD